MIIPPLPTPFDPQGRFDLQAFRELAQAIEPHVDGLLFYGSNGEGVHLSREERTQGLAAQSPKKPVLVGLMEETLAQATAALAEAEGLGARVLATPPRYYEASLGPDGLLRYFCGLAEAGQSEVWLYHVPANTKAQLPLSVVAELAQHPRITGIKDSSGELSRLAFYASQKLALEVYTGHAPTFLGALALGAKGGILAAANLAPKPYKRLLELWQAGKVGEAQALQAELEPFGRVLAQGGFVLLKQALRYLGLPGGYPRPPYPSESPAWPAFKPLLEAFRERSWTVE
ncbi:N-acetylneuraminate lyase [Meiothermus luteus]|jgi:dihydrodipicolinate synthase/N-acetylneuraminate lyase|uniref:N-acetylneuraminate lyase n=1 Tax=Meiothermus luteus TaxID=2026184 RepID=A0A399EYT5_9DEIN|nr:dihydrodipicolinate synthase family protein [Meiothermus luteus]RIH89178.1 N-acetylneuraminate lyase [Meiothermus luteus]RMH56904.1 MAG: dihydrodipicolinate synthase family protein [Deinococcota bacterium]